ncbi:MAG: glutamate--tRNA ligase [Actinobacteria bacterium]|nr:glutamate--tRNA ligase [Actinomycetota bacterium]
MAPSPTGYLHVGTARTALFNWLFARHHGGTFIVRVDDTDLERSTAEYEEEILSSFRWLGLHWDEGIEVGGPHGTYRQSDRLDRYRSLARRLVDDGLAYYDDRSPGELDLLRTKAQGEGRHPGHYIRRPETPFEKGVIRLAIPEGHAVAFDDLIRGTVSFEPEALDDFVILRSDGTPTYHLASTVDDIDYEITHVARGEDLLPSTPKHILLTRALGGEAPVYAHLPLLLGPDGKKLSKRHGATALSDYRTSGILPEAMFNYLAILGWSLDAQTTIFSREEAVEEFDLADVSKNPSAFDPDKLVWMNGEYIRAMPEEEFSSRARPWVEEALGRALLEDEWPKFEEIAAEVQERTKLLPEVGDQVRFLFEEIDEYDPAAWSKVMEREEVPKVLEESLARLSNLKSWDPVSIESTLREIPEMLGIGAGKAFQPLRVAVTGSSVSPPLFESMAALGQHPTLARIERARQELG